MTDRITLTVRALQGKRGAVVARDDAFLVANMSVIRNGKPVGVLAVDFQGEEIPTDDDLNHELLIVGNYTRHPKHGNQFAVFAWAIANDSPVAGPSIRHRKARKLSADALRKLAGNMPE